MKNNRFVALLIILLLIIITLVFLGIIIISISRIKTSINTNRLVDKGYEIFGNSYCNGHSDVTSSGQAISSWTCQLCGYKGVNSNTEVPAICENCAKITDRCTKCGKLRINYMTIYNGKSDYNSKIIYNYQGFLGLVQDFELKKEGYDKKIDKYDEDYFTKKSLYVINLPDIDPYYNLNFSIDGKTLICKPKSDENFSFMSGEKGKVVIVEIEKNITKFQIY